MSPSNVINASRLATAHTPERIAVDQGEEPADWQLIYSRLSEKATGFPSILLGASVVASTFAGLLAALTVLGLSLRALAPGISIHVLACLVAPPAFLVGAAAGQAGGNFFFRMWTCLDDASRRGFSTRFTLGRTPAYWPDALCRWLFTGNWMSAPVYDARLPYVRIFVMGDAPAACREEDDLWREIHGQISGDSLWEAGANHREISYPRALPNWAKQIEKGDGVEELKKRIGEKTAMEWVRHLWRRAYRQWPTLQYEEYPADAKRRSFEIHFLNLSDNRDALVVVLRPTRFAEEVAGQEKDAGRDAVAA